MENSGLTLRLVIKKSHMLMVGFTICFSPPRTGFPGVYIKTQVKKVSSEIMCDNLCVIKVMPFV